MNMIIIVNYENNFTRFFTIECSADLDLAGRTGLVGKDLRPFKVLVALKNRLIIESLRVNKYVNTI